MKFLDWAFAAWDTILVVVIVVMLALIIRKEFFMERLVDVTYRATSVHVGGVLVGTPEAQP